jgi:hypothetical protein
MGWTDVNAALAMAYQQLVAGPEARPGHAKAIILFTDGRPQTAEVTTPAADDSSLAELRQWVRRFAGQDAAFFAILLGNPITDADPQMSAVYRPFWADLAQAGMKVRFYDVQAGDDLLDVYHEVSVQLQEGQSQGAILDRPVQGQAEMPVDIPAGWARATFVARKSTPDLSLTLLRPDGTPARAGDRDVRRQAATGERVEVWSIDAPQAGPWTLRADGQGVVTVWLDYRELPPTPTATQTAPPTPAATATRSATSTPTASPTTTATDTSSSTPTATAVAAAVGVGADPEADPAPRQAPWGWLLLAGATIATAGGLGATSLRRRRPIVEGKLRVLQAPEGEQPGKTWNLGDSRRTVVGVGRGSDQLVALSNDPALLPKTALIRAERGADGHVTPWLVDLSGIGMVRIKGKPRGSRVALADGDVIEIGAYLLRYENVGLHRQAQPWRPPVARP